LGQGARSAAEAAAQAWEFRYPGRFHGRLDVYTCNVDAGNLTADRINWSAGPSASSFCPELVFLLTYPSFSQKSRKRVGHLAPGGLLKQSFRKLLYACRSLAASFDIQ
jgi:hypothetical protein